jgi:hypothetical protein
LKKKKKKKKKKTMEPQEWTSTLKKKKKKKNPTKRQRQTNKLQRRRWKVGTDLAPARTTFVLGADLAKNAAGPCNHRMTVIFRQASNIAQ